MSRAPSVLMAIGSYPTVQLGVCVLTSCVIFPKVCCVSSQVCTFNREEGRVLVHQVVRVSGLPFKEFLLYFGRNN